MSYEATIACSCLSRLFRRLRFSALSRDTSSDFSTPTRIIAQISAVGLVAASAGFGAVYAWTTGSQHGLALACLMVLMAVALELAKPLSLAAAFAAFRSWSIFRGAALAILALVAIAYSLTSELSLMATSRGDVVASREASINSTSNIDSEIRRARDGYERAKAELDTLPNARPASELQAEIEGLLLTPGADGCTAINGKVTRDVCPKVATLRTEKARAARRAELEQTIAKPLPVAPAQDQHVVTKADPAASALSAYLAFFGIVISPAVLSELIVLVGVIALEAGSALAGILAQSFSGPPRVVQGVASVKRDSPAKPVQATPVHVVHPARTADTVDVVQAREKVKSAIVTKLREQGGSVRGGERGLAKLMGANRSTMRRAINGLVMAGVVAAEATRNGTVLRLVA